MKFEHLIFLVLLLFSRLLSAQDITFEANKTSLKPDDELLLKVIIKNSDNSDVSTFPSLLGFQKRGRTVSHAEVKEKGKKVLQHTIEQKYISILPGVYQLDSLNFVINGENYKFDPITISVEDPDSSNQSTSNLKLYLYVNKSEIFVKEGLKVNIGLLVPKTNTETFEFSKSLNQELAIISKRLEPEDCLIDRKNIVDITATDIVFQNEDYIKYTLYEAVYYPIIQQEIILPSVSIAVEKELEIDSTKSETVRLRSNPFKIAVKELPPHPLREVVPVGQVSISGNSVVKTMTTGKIYEYTLRLKGEGNISSYNIPKPENDGRFDFYPPKVREQVNAGKNYGEKTFTFKIFPKKPESINIGAYFPFIYFNEAQATYDTLIVDTPIDITGEEISNTSNSSEDIYGNIENLEISNPSTNYREIIKNIANILLFLGIGTVLINLYWYKTNKS